MLTVPVTVEEDVGVKVTLIGQVPLIDTDPTQLFVWLNPVPEIDTDEIVNVAVPVLVSVIVCVALWPIVMPENVSEVGLKDTAGDEPDGTTAPIYHVDRVFPLISTPIPVIPVPDRFVPVTRVPGK